MVTPVHIQPEWYLLYAYAILRSIPNKVGGVFALIASFSVLFLVPFFQFNSCRSLVFRPLSRLIFLFFLGNFFLLTWVGGLPVEEPYILLGQLAAAFYFIYFLILGPLAGFLEDLCAHIAQMVERFLCKQVDTSSTLVVGLGIFCLWQRF